MITAEQAKRMQNTLYDANMETTFDEIKEMIIKKAQVVYNKAVIFDFFRINDGNKQPISRLSDNSRMMIISKLEEFGYEIIGNEKNYIEFRWN